MNVRTPSFQSMARPSPSRRSDNGFNPPADITTSMVLVASYLTFRTGTGVMPRRDVFSFGVRGSLSANAFQRANENPRELTSLQRERAATDMAALRNNSELIL